MAIIFYPLAMSKIQFKGEIAQMGKALASLAAYHQQMQKGLEEDAAKEERNQERKLELKEKLKQFKGHFQSFAKQCSSEWGAVYREFLLIINYVVELYQIRVAKLQVLNESQRRQIQNLLQQKSRQCPQHRNLQQSSLQSKQLSLSVQNDLSHCRKVKISDVIASYQSSVLTPAGVSLSSSQLGIDQEYYSTRFERRGKAASYGDELCFIGNLSRLENEYSKRGKDQYEDKQNICSFISSRKASQTSSNKRGRSGIKNRESTEPSPCSKLSELRKQLFSNKKI